MTYFLMLLFVFWSLLLFAYNKMWKDQGPIGLFWSVSWSALGAFFFHNIM